MHTRISERLFTIASIGKLGGRGISVSEARETPGNEHVVVRNPNAPVPGRRFLIGKTNGGRYLTLVIEAAADPTTWLVVTGWDATRRERKMVDGG